MFFVAIEGMDAAGKATQSKRLAQWFKDQPSVGQVLESSFPAYDSITGRLILDHLQKRWVAQPSGRGAINHADILDPLVFQVLQTANRLENIPAEAWSRPAGTVWVADRYHASALVYGALDGLPLDLLEKLNTSLPKPDRYLLLDIPVECSIERRPERRDRYEADIDYLRLIRERYLALFREREAQGYRIIDGTKSADEVHAAILEAVGAPLAAPPITGVPSKHERESHAE